jgi:hypothetical protein
MTANHYKWQHRWRVDHASGIWHHETGLQVQCQPDGTATSLNGPQIADELAPKHGPHNAPAMVHRLLREAQRMQATLAPPQGTQGTQANATGAPRHGY